MITKDLNLQKSEPIPLSILETSGYGNKTILKQLGLMFNDGMGWKSHRRFSLKTLKDFGFGKASLDHILIEEADRMGEFFLNQKNEPFLVQTLFNLVILNVLWTIVAGKR